MITVYRIDQVVGGKSYEGGKFYRLRNEAEKKADAQLDADRQTGEYRTSYIVVEVSI